MVCEEFLAKWQFEILIKAATTAVQSLSYPSCCSEEFPPSPGHTMNFASDVSLLGHQPHHHIFPTLMAANAICQALCLPVCHAVCSVSLSSYAKLPSVASRNLPLSPPLSWFFGPPRSMNERAAKGTNQDIKLNSALFTFSNEFKMFSTTPPGSLALIWYFHSLCFCSYFPLFSQQTWSHWPTFSLQCPALRWPHKKGNVLFDT